MRDKKWLVYKHTFPNGKSYIGITCKDPKDRWRNGEGYKGQRVYRAIKKYGWNNIKHEILEENLTIEQANEREKYYIQKFNTFIYSKNTKGYNCTLGGDGTCGTPLSDEQKELLAKIHNSPEFKEMLCKRNKEMAKKIFQYSDDGEFLQEFDSITEASREYEVSTSSLSWAVKNETLCVGYQWRFYQKNNIGKYYKRNLRPVIQFDLETGKIINRFNSISEAEIETGISCIVSVCTKKNKSAGGYGWKYDDGSEILLSDYKHITTGEEVWQFSRDYKLLGMFESQRQASEITGIDYRHINKSVVRHSVTNGYIFIKPQDIEYLNSIKQKINIPIHKYDLDGNYICSYKNAHWVRNNLGVALKRIGEGFMSGGFQWVQSFDYKKKIKPYYDGHSKSVNQYDKNFKIIKTYNSIKEAEIATGATNISLCCERKRNSSGGYIWRYTDDCKDIEARNVKRPYESLGRAVCQYDKDMNLLNIFVSLKIAEDTTGIKKGSIWNCCKMLSKTAGGYIWRYADEVNLVA